jgi:hypothetical protein
MNCLYDFFKDSLYMSYYMNEADEKALCDFRDDCKANLELYKHDRSYNRNKYKRLQVIYRYLNDKLNQYETLKKEGKLILVGDIQPTPALEQLKEETFSW